MKFSKKFVMAIVALTMCSASALASACSEGEWQLTTPPTCTEAGVETNSKTNQTRPIDPLGHDYGEWEVNAPTETDNGLAKKQCANDEDHDHDITVNLPVLTDSAYTAEIGNDKITYTYPDENGDISFDVGLTVATALNAVSANKNGVISGGGTVTTRTASVNNTSYSEATSDIYYEFGDNYVHVDDGAQNTKVWYTRNGDDIFSVAMRYNRFGEEQIERSNAGDIEETFDGYGFGFIYLMGANKVYGAENFAKYLYDLGAASESSGFKTSMTDNQGKTVYSFSYFYYEYNSDATEDYVSDGTGYLHAVSVTFTVDKNSVMDSFDVEAKTYVTKEWVVDDDDWLTGRYEETGNLVQTEDGYAVAEGREDKWKRYERYSLTQKSELADGEKMPESPYTYDNMIVKSFKVNNVTLDASLQVKPENIGAEVLSGDTVTLTPARGSHFLIQDITPSTANLDFDEIKFYLEKNGELEELVFNGSAKDGDINVYFSNENHVFTINSYIAGDFKILLKTTECEFSININVPVNAPTSFAANVYKYDEVTGAESWNNRTTSETVYEGEELKFNASVAHPLYEETDYTVTVTDAAGKDVTQSVITEGYIEGTPVSVFKADTAGVYTVTLKTAYTGSTAKASFTVNVENAPLVSEILNGEYFNPENNLSVVFVPASEGAANGSVTFSLGGEYETVYSYSYNAQSGTIDLTYESGPDMYPSSGKVVFGYELELTSSYGLFVNFNSNVGEKLRVNLVSESAQDAGISGTYNSSDGLELTVPASGKYLVTLENSSNYGLFGIFIDGNLTMISKATELELEEGQVIKGWSPMAGVIFTIEFEG